MGAEESGAFTGITVREVPLKKGFGEEGPLTILSGLAYNSGRLLNKESITTLEVNL